MGWKYRMHRLDGSVLTKPPHDHRKSKRRAANRAARRARKAGRK